MSRTSAMRQRTVCFTGHRKLGAPAEYVTARVVEIIERLIQEGYLYFGAGGARGFDALASEAVLNLKARYPRIHLILVLPFDEQYTHERDWTRLEIEQYHSLKARASKTVILSEGYSSGVYYRRNRHLVDNASVCVAYLTRPNTGTSYTVNYAKSQGLRVLNVEGPG